MRVPIFFIGVAAMCLCLAPALSAESGDDSAAIQEILDQKSVGRQSCSQARKALRQLRKDYPTYSFAFAGRKDSTITGIRGCGYAWNVSAVKAQARALSECRKWEVKFGTGDDGTKLCRLMR